MKINKEILLKNSWHDKAKNTLIFSDTGIPALGISISKNHILLCLDTNECSEGMFEETDGTKEDILSILKGNGYFDMAEVFEAWLKK
ncbi:MAG: hypothetical protein LKJ25_01205 [Clostridia bacterium]|jgi:hypothetical protein|nr:hypothetical protein [Clostridia bacterium]